MSCECPPTLDRIMNRIGNQDQSLQPGPIDVRGPCLEVYLPSRYPTNMAAVLVDRPGRVHPRFRQGLLFSARLLTKPHQVFWQSHISVDFVTSLPSSCSNTIIPAVVDHFSKMAHFLLVQPPFGQRQRAAGLQSISCSQLGAMVSPSPSSYPRDNGSAYSVRHLLCSH